ncbi:GYDIA family GHMP kinase [Sediminibacter sp. Hel_I_10]|uniref:GYDIA family GHMP kinase n=1 Tax=Sediminibacter sp. Hel_I_10 TaxID=1392490 RepID=UPI000B0477C9
MNIKEPTYKSNGKLLITGEYVVLDGALALALPTQLGQSLSITRNSNRDLVWNSYDYKHQLWFKMAFELGTSGSLRLLGDENDISKRLLQILNAAKQLNPNFLQGNTKGYLVETHLEFPRDWGLGASSTVINNIANWANIDAYQLLDLTFGGSGYDLACAEANGAITYQLNKNDPKVSRAVSSVTFNPSFKEHLYFVHLNQKQNSRDGIARYRRTTSDTSNVINEITRITQDMILCKSLLEFQSLIDRHEALISEVIKQDPVKQTLFSDLNGSIKSLGAWGGDFVMVASHKDPKPYFKSKGFNTIIKYQDLIKN